ncbi:choice-of-anchor D domain-containing protein [Flavobacterium azooxidireducens]|uniref:Choice-of-anchor D domain-containing protein n=1 Tax=Flavobacterium azooxidireducens TaxID=1871076 RepID=A0ABY4KNE5_9FLAO|nr:choice-of-anchor D domain-containing protein [Flavobacterium azooxidireducens]UPQ80767.1 choice-of-anchor D domain-containing protein [Flavobacterium azooxidireducens]
MKTRILLVALFLSAFSWGQSIFENPITGTNPNTANPYTTGQVVAPNLTVSGIGRGAGALGAGANNRYNASSWNTAAIDLTAYFEFTLTPASGYQIDFVSFVYTGQLSGGPANFAFRSSLDGYASNIGTPNAAGTTISLAVATYQGITSAVTFRFYVWGTDVPTRTFSINDFIFNGYVYSTAPAAPIITSELNVSGFVGDPFSYTITAINSPTTFNATSLPPGFSINATTGVITGTPGATGTFYISIFAINASGSDEQTLTLTVSNPGPEINVRGATGATNNIVNGSTIPNAFNNTLYAAQNIGNNQLKDFRIQNIGISNLNLTGVPRVQLSGHTADFTVTTQPSLTVLPGGFSDFVIRFAPTTGGVRTAVVSIINNDSDENPYTFTIQGTGIAPDINVIGNGLDVINGSTTTSLTNHTNFGNVNEAGAASKDRNFYIANYGGANLTLSAATISGPNAADFTIFASPVTPVVANSVSILTIRFNPSALGLRQATVSIPNNVSGKNPYVFAISGVGINFDECVLTTPSVIFAQNFDTVNTLGYTPSTFSTGTTPVVAGGQAFGSSRSVPSNKFIGTRSLQVNGAFAASYGDNDGYSTVLFNTIDVTSYAEVELRFNVGAYSTSTTQGLDFGSDQIRVFVSSDGGVTWSNELIIKGDDNSIWDINTATPANYETNFRGVNIPLQTVPTTTNSVNLGNKYYRLTTMPISNQLRIKFEFYVDRSDEIWVLDNVEIRGRTPFTSVWESDNWTGGAPDQYRKAIFRDDYNTGTNGNVVACECEIDATHAVTINANNHIQSAGRIINNGTLNIQNNGSLIQLDDYAVNSGNIGLTRTANIRRLDYVYWSSPVASFPVLNISTGTPASNVFKWLPTIGGNFGNWTAANEDMEEGKGYIVRGPSSFTTTIQPFNTIFTGESHNGIITPEIQRGSYTGAGYPSPTNPLITVTANDDNFNLVGNPYPSAIRALDFLNENTNIEGSVRIWTHGVLPDIPFNDPFYNNFVYNYDPNDYIVYNAVGPSTGPSFNGFIASGQGFFVLMNDGAAATETVTFKNSMRNIAHANNQFFRSSSELNGESDFKIWLDFIPQNGSPSRTLLGYVDGATNEKDRLFDASTKVDGSSKMYSLIDNKPFIIQGRPLPFDENDVVPLGYNTTTAGTFTVAIAEVIGLENRKVYLKDKMLNSIHDLTSSPYVFDSNAGEVNNRFELRYTNETLSNPNFNEVASSVIAFGSNGQLRIKSSLEKINSVLVYDVLGRVVFSQKEQGTNEFVANTNFSKQTVIVQIELENGQVVTKKLIL